MTITSNDLLNRLRRMYAAVNATMESDITKLPANVSQNEKSITLVQDFSGSSSNHDFENAVQMVIANIASLHDHLKKWSRANGKNTSSIDSILASSPDLQIVHDLWNRDKHGDGRRDGGRSKRNPKLIKISSKLILSTKPTKGSSVIVTLGANGTPCISGDGSAKAVLTAMVVDQNENNIGDLFDIAKRCIQAWEVLMEDLGIITISDSKSMT